MFAKMEIPLIRDVYAALPLPGVSRPIFIIGCGRSGTTILGTALSKHRAITYLNEPRGLWFSAYPETDIWTSKARVRNGKLYLGAADASRRKSKRLSRLFRFETIRRGRPVLVEKLPINNFRLNFIYRAFPDARFIHIYRNGLEVARSIEKLSKMRRWFGADSYKWEKLVEYAAEHDDGRALPALCKTYFDKGLLEWRLSTEAAVKFLSGVSEDVFCEVNYDEFTASPVETMTRLLEFIGVSEDQSVNAFVRRSVVRRSSRLDRVEVSNHVRKLGGKLLPLSMNGASSLTARAR